MVETQGEMRDGIHVILHDPPVCLVKAFSIQEAWFWVIQACYQYGQIYKIERGSSVGHQRWELAQLSLIITHPERTPFSPTLPDGITPPTSEDYIHQYFADYLVSPEKKPDEAYTYGQRIYPQLNPVIEMLKETPNTNHATIEVARPEDTTLEDPPCLRLISFKLREGIVRVYAFFRSWDVWSGLPSNLGALQMLAQLVAGEVGCQTGLMYLGSDGAHLYDFHLELVEAYLPHLTGAD